MDVKPLSTEGYVFNLRRHKAKCCMNRLDCYLHGQGHSERSNPQNMTSIILNR